MIVIRLVIIVLLAPPFYPFCSDVMTSWWSKSIYGGCWGEALDAFSLIFPREWSWIFKLTISSSTDCPIKANRGSNSHLMSYKSASQAEQLNVKINSSKRWTCWQRALESVTIQLNEKTEEQGNNVGTIREQLLSNKLSARANSFKTMLCQSLKKKKVDDQVPGFLCVPARSSLFRHPIFPGSCNKKKNKKVLCFLFIFKARIVFKEKKRRW